MRHLEPKNRHFIQLTDSESAAIIGGLNYSLGDYLSDKEVKDGGDGGDGGDMPYLDWKAMKKDWEANWAQYI